MTMTVIDGRYLAPNLQVIIPWYRALMKKANNGTTYGTIFFYYNNKKVEFPDSLMETIRAEALK